MVHGILIPARQLLEKSAEPTERLSLISTAFLSTFQFFCSWSMFCARMLFEQLWLCNHEGAGRQAFDVTFFRDLVVLKRAEINDRNEIVEEANRRLRILGAEQEEVICMESELRVEREQKYIDALRYALIVSWADLALHRHEEYAWMGVDEFNEFSVQSWNQLTLSTIHTTAVHVFEAFRSLRLLFHRETLKVTELVDRKNIFTDVFFQLDEIYSYEYVQRTTILEKEHLRFVSATKIERFFRSYKHGGIVGRSGRLEYFRLCFWEKREKAAIKKVVTRQKKEVREVEEELIGALREHEKHTTEEVAEGLRFTAVYEKRNRDSLVIDADQFFRLVYQNFTAIREAILKRDVRTLEDLEGYRRLQIQETQRKDFGKQFIPKKQTFLEDVRIRAAQRCWRCYVARQTYRRRLSNKIISVTTHEEWSSRLSIKLQETEDRHFVTRRHLARLLLGKHLEMTIKNILIQMAVDPAGLINEERRCRLSLVWNAQSWKRGEIVEKQEAEEWAHIQEELYPKAVLVLSISELESTNRQAIEREFQITALNTAVTVEREIRARIWNAERVERENVLLVCETHRRHVMTLIEFPTIICSFLSRLEQEVRMMWERKEANERSVKQLMSLEACARIKTAKEKFSLLKFWSSLLDGFEVCVRHQIEVVEEKERMRLFVLQFQEIRERATITQEWMTKMSRTAEYSAAFVVFSPPYLYLCEAMENDLRKIYYARDVQAFWDRLFHLKHGVRCGRSLALSNSSGQNGSLRLSGGEFLDAFSPFDYVLV